VKHLPKTAVKVVTNRKGRHRRTRTNYCSWHYLDAKSLNGQEWQALMDGKRNSPNASQSLALPIVSPRGWQSVFGKARQEEVESVDAVMAREFEHIDPDK
jgi:hypothetical protein